MGQGCNHDRSGCLSARLIAGAADITLVTLDAAGLRDSATVEDLRAFVGDCSPNVCVITETHLRKHDVSGPEVPGLQKRPMTVEGNAQRLLRRFSESVGDSRF